MGSADDLALHRNASLTVGNDTDRMAHLMFLNTKTLHRLLRKTHVEHGVVGYHGAYATENSHIILAEHVNTLTRLLIGYPLAVACGCGYLAVERHSPLSCNPRHIGGDILKEHTILHPELLNEFLSCLSTVPVIVSVIFLHYINADACLTQYLQSLASHERIGVEQTHHYTTDAMFYNSIHARWLVTLMTARFERNI